MPLRQLLAAALLLLATAVPAHAQLSPDARWRTFDTPHFVVHYPEGLEELARAAAARAEGARAVLDSAFVRPPRGRVHLVVSDDADLANGSASVLPRNRVVVYAHAPVDEPSLAFTDDWLELLIAHELAHVHHLDYAAAPWGALRPLLGRHPVTFPNATVPTWTTEGLATWLESRLTGAGRVHGSIHEMILRTAVLEDRFFSIDRVSGGPASWPGGNAAYVYGSLFHEYLAERYGEERAGAFVREVGGRWIPQLLDDAARRSFGVSFTRAWGDWEAELRARYAAVADSLRAEGVAEPEILVAAGHRTESPRWSPDGTRLAFSQATGRDAPATRVLYADGRVETLASRTMPGPLAWLPDGSGVVTAQIDVVGRTRYLSDLYRVDADGGERRLTRGARLLDPDVRRRDGRIVAARGGGAWNALVLLDAEGREARTLVPSAPDVNWAAPRWSPEGDRIAVARWRTGGMYDVVVLDTAGRVVRELTADRALDLTPAWSADGRYVVFASDRAGIFDLYAFDLLSGALLRVTRTLTGAFQPDVSPDGRWIALLAYRADGYHVARIPFDPSTWTPAPPLRPEAARPGADPARYPTTIGGPSRPYSALATLAPTSWSPLFVADSILGFEVGASVGGSDVVGRHAWGAVFALRPENGQVQGTAAYLFAGLGNPTLGGSVLQEWTLVRRGGTIWGSDTLRTPLVARQRSASAVATFARPRFRSYAWASVGANLRSIHYDWLDRDLAPADPAPQRVPEVGAVLTAGRSSARSFDFSVSAEEGWTAAAQVEGRRFVRALPGAGGATGYARLAGRLQGYQALPAPGFARPVLAVRLLGAADVGSRGPGFTAGGVYGGGFAGPLSTGTGIGSVHDFPVRGYGEAAQFGDRAWAASLEARIPLALVERGWRLVPLFLDRVWVTPFADAGSAWCSAECPFAGVLPHRPMVSAGAELGMDLTLFFHGALPLVVGVAAPLTDAGPPLGRPGPGVYVRVGRAF